MTLYFYLIKLGVHIGHSKIDWNPQLNTYLAGQTKSNYLIFNINKSMFFLKRTLLFYKLLGLNNGSFVIYYLGNLNNYTDLLEGSLDREGMIPHSYPFIYSIIKPGFFSNWKTNYKKLIKMFYKVIFYNPYFFISLMNKIYYDFLNNPKSMDLKSLLTFSAKFNNIINETRNKYTEKLRLKRLFFQYVSFNKSRIINKLNKLRVKKSKKQKKLSTRLEMYNNHLVKSGYTLEYLTFKKPIQIKKRRKKRINSWNLKLDIKKRINFHKIFRDIRKNNKTIQTTNNSIKNILQFLNYNILNANKYNKKNISDNLMDQSFKMFFYNIYNIFLRIFFRRLNFKSNNLSLTPVEYKYFVRFLKFTLIFRYLKRINKIPNSLLLLNPELNLAQLTDFKFLKIAVVGIVDSNSSLQSLSYFIPSNDDSIIILLFYVKLLISSFESGKKTLYLKHLVNNINYKNLLITNNNLTLFNKPQFNPLSSLTKQFEKNKLYLNKLRDNYYNKKTQQQQSIKKTNKQTSLEKKLKLKLVRLKKLNLLQKLNTQNTLTKFQFKYIVNKRKLNKSHKIQKH